MNNFICPNFSNHDVFEEFNQMIEAFGGRPLTMDECKSSELRNQRTGLDYSAMEFAYKVYHMNNGNSIMYAPNGKRSILYNTLLELLGNPIDALVAKAHFYTDKYISTHNWFEDNTNVKLDINGEPYLDFTSEIKVQNKIVNKFNASSNKTFFGDSFDAIMSGEAVSSSSIISNLLLNDLLSDQNIQLAQILSKHSMPVKISSQVGQDFMTTYTDAEGQSIVLINPSLIGKASNRLAADTFIHEVVHALTVNAFNNPLSIADERLVHTTNALYSQYSKLFPADIYDRSNRSTGMYALTNQKEFVAEFITNKATRDLIYNKAVSLDKAEGKTLLGKIKNFINAITKFLVNKKVFSNNQDELIKYETQLKKYLLNSKAVTYTKYKPSLVTQLLNSKLDDVIINNDKVIMLSRNITDIINTLEANKATFSEEETKKSLDKMCDEVAKILNKRIAAIRVSNMPSDKISAQTEILQSLIQQFRMRTASYFDIISLFMTQLMPLLLEDVREIRKVCNQEGSTITNTEYMYHAHDNFGTYNKALDTILKVLDDNMSVKFIEDNISNDDLSNKSRIIKNITALNEAINKTKALSEQGSRMCDELLIRCVKKTITDVSEQTHTLDYVDYLNLVEDIKYDTSVFYEYFGSLDKAKDNSLRTLFHLVDNAINKAEMKTNSKAVKLLKLQENLSLKESVKDLYERDKDGFTTGYLVRKLNYGLFYSDYNKFLQQLNLEMGQPIYTRVAPEDNTVYKTIDGKDVTVKLYWNNLRNEWLSEHCERRFTKEYYKAYSNLSQATRDRREEIQSQIRLLKEKAFGEDGFYHYEKLTSQEYSKLQDLYFQKRLLKDTKDINGDRKTGVDLLIALELQLLDTLYKDSPEVKRNRQKWVEAHLKVFEECGGDAEYSKGTEGNFDFKRYNTWVDRNCEKTLKRDSQGRVLLFKRISLEMSQEPIYQHNGDGGVLYASLKQQYNDLLNVRRDFATGDVRVQNMSPAVTAKLKELYKLMHDIKQAAIREDSLNGRSTLRRLAKEKALLYRKYTKTEKTQLYKQLEEEARIGGYLDQFHRATGYMAADEYSDEMQFVPDRWYTKILPKDEYMKDFYEVTPGKGWIDYEDDNQFVNKEFKALEKENEGESMIPKAFDKNGKKLYDNSSAFSKATSGNLGKLYKGIFDTLKESNAKYTNRKFNCNYLLPQVPGSFVDRLKSMSGRWNAIKDYIKEGVGIDDTRYFDLQYGQSVDDILENFDEFGEVIKQNDETNGDSVHGQRPDGRDLHMVPQYYVRKLKDPSLISSDIVGITCEYYKQALTFENKQQVKDQCEAILDMLEKRTVSKTRLSILKKGDSGSAESSTNVVPGSKSHTYKIARQFLDTHLYDVKLGKHEGHLGNKTIRLGKAAQAYRALTTAINLGCNLMVAATGFLTSAGAHLVQQIVGRRYSIHDGTRAFIELIHQMVLTKSGYNTIANRTSKNKLMVLAETYNLSNQGARKYNHSDRNRLVNAINENWCFGMMTSLDYIVKSNIMLTIMMSYLMYNGEFLTKEDLDLRLWNKDKSFKKDAERERKKGIYLYDILNTETGELEIPEEYKEAYSKIESKLKAKITKWSEDADGMATERLKAAITTNFVGAAILTHRQYLPLMLQSRYGKTVEDMDTEMYDGGTFRSGAQSLKLLAMPLWDMCTLSYKVGNMNKSTKYQALIGGALGVLVDASVISSPFSFLGAITGAALGALSSMDSNTSNKFNDYFYNTSSLKEYALSKARRAHLKQIATELIMYHLFITPIINALSAFADDDDDDKDKIAFAIVKYITSLLNIDSDSQAIQMAAYLGRRFQWEFYTAYRGDDILNNIKTVSAQTGTNDKIENALSEIYRSIFPRETLLDTFLQWNIGENSNYEDYDYYVNRGLYSESETKEFLTGESRFARWLKAIFKLLPFHHLYEQLYDSKSKRSYQENQIMGIKD